MKRAVQKVGSSVKTVPVAKKQKIDTKQTKKPDAFCLLAIAGPHAGCTEDSCWQAKIDDINNIGETYWNVFSPKARADAVRRLCQKAEAAAEETETSSDEGRVWVYFLGASSKGGAKMTHTRNVATHWAVDKTADDWKPFNPKMSALSGKISAQTCALRFDKLEYIEDEGLHVDLWDYGEFEAPEKPVKFNQGTCMQVVQQHDNSGHKDRMKSHIRPVCARARLADPFAVYLQCREG
eukprot:TRINITY_DN67604_c11_g5_i1.p1 TRINITY_DN67604_c11_g5~~TRINITY_DN67604_c11_g5_i1.p1  ORF type:complete len:237 (-),score=13.22 TRINITY_DN67604_c11_g5_i1:171-881(-)